jgi:hypothetical protein
MAIERDAPWPAKAMDPCPSQQDETMAKLSVSAAPHPTIAPQLALMAGLQTQLDLADHLHLDLVAIRIAEAMDQLVAHLAPAHPQPVSRQIQ